MCLKGEAGKEGKREARFVREEKQLDGRSVRSSPLKNLLNRKSEDKEKTEANV